MMITAAEKPEAEDESDEVDVSGLVVETFALIGETCVTLAAVDAKERVLVLDVGG